MAGSDRLREAILAAYVEFEAANAATV